MILVAIIDINEIMIMTLVTLFLLLFVSVRDCNRHENDYCQCRFRNQKNTKCDDEHLNVNSISKSEKWSKLYHLILPKISLTNDMLIGFASSLIIL